MAIPLAHALADGQVSCACPPPVRPVSHEEDDQLKDGRPYGKCLTCQDREAEYADGRYCGVCWFDEIGTAERELRRRKRSRRGRRKRPVPAQLLTWMTPAQRAGSEKARWRQQPEEDPEEAPETPPEDRPETDRRGVRVSPEKLSDEEFASLLGGVKGPKRRAKVKRLAKRQLFDGTSGVVEPERLRCSTRMAWRWNAWLAQRKTTGQLSDEDEGMVAEEVRLLKWAKLPMSDEELARKYGVPLLKDGRVARVPYKLRQLEREVSGDPAVVVVDVVGPSRGKTLARVSAYAHGSEEIYRPERANPARDVICNEVIRGIAQVEYPIILVGSGHTRWGRGAEAGKGPCPACHGRPPRRRAELCICIGCMRAHEDWERYLAQKDHKELWPLLARYFNAKGGCDGRGRG
jgi:hypothetical protein